MKFRWETQEERLLRDMRLPAKKKLEWLREINEFTAKYSSKHAKQIRSKSRA